MIIDQEEINRLLEQAGAESGDVATAPEPARPVARVSGAASKPMGAGPGASRPASPNVARILRIRVPVIVQLARRSLPVALIRNLSLGAILDFEKNADDPLEILVRSHPVGAGVAVCVGEHFGLRVTSVVSAADRVASIAGK